MCFAQKARLETLSCIEARLAVEIVSEPCDGQDLMLTSIVRV
jgi:hypothetical protein